MQDEKNRLCENNHMNSKLIFRPILIKHFFYGMCYITLYMYDNL